MKTRSHLSFAIVVILLLPMLTAFAADKPCKYEEPKTITGTIYQAGSNRKTVLFKFKRTATRSGNIVTSVREFLNTDGTVADRETTVYDGNDLVSYKLEELQINAVGTAKLVRDPKAEYKIVFEYTKDLSAPTKVSKGNETLKPNTINNDMIGAFLVAHWDELMRGEELKTRYIAASRAETVGFTFVKDSEFKWQGKDAVKVKMVPTSFIIAALVDDLYFTFEKAAPHRCFEYDGRTLPKTKDGKKWKDLDAETVFDLE